jgi:hypothetical protein
MITPFMKVDSPTLMPKIETILADAQGTVSELRASLSNIGIELDLGVARFLGDVDSITSGIRATLDQPLAAQLALWLFVSMLAMVLLGLALHVVLLIGQVKRFFYPTPSNGQFFHPPPPPYNNSSSIRHNNYNNPSTSNGQRPPLQYERLHRTDPDYHHHNNDIDVAGAGPRETCC